MGDRDGSNPFAAAVKMNERDIFEHLFRLALQSSDADGVVTTCVVRDGKVLLDAVSEGAPHAEYVLLRKMREQGVSFLQDDVVYVTLQPCDRRTPGGEGEKFGDCTTNLIQAGVKRVVYAATYPKSKDSKRRFKDAGVSVRQVADAGIVMRAVKLFNSTCSSPADHLPIPHSRIALTNIAVFILFFGVALIEALGRGNWLEAALFLSLGVLSLLADFLKKD